MNVETLNFLRRRTAPTAAALSLDLVGGGAVALGRAPVSALRLVGGEEERRRGFDGDVRSADVHVKM